MEKEKEKEKEKEDEVIYELNLFTWGPRWEFPSFDPFCLATETVLRFAEASFGVNVCYNPRVSPNGELPILADQDQVFVTTAGILKHLKEKGIDLDGNLTAVQRAESLAYSTLVEDRLHDSLLFLWWMEDENTKKMILPLYRKSLSFPWNYILPDQIQKRVKQRLSYLKEKNDVDYINEVYLSAREIYQSLSVKLGEKPFFFGDEPSNLDAIVFGHLAIHYFAPLPNNKLKIVLDAFPNLVTFLVKTKQRLFSSWVPPQGTPSPRKSPSKPRGQTPQKPTEKVEKTAIQKRMEMERRGFLLGLTLFLGCYIFSRNMKS